MKIITTWSHISVTGETLIEVIYNTVNLTSNSSFNGVITPQTISSIGIKTLVKTLTVHKTRLKYEFISQEIFEKTETYLETDIFEFTLSTALKAEDKLKFEETVGITLQNKLEGSFFLTFFYN